MLSRFSPRPDETRFWRASGVAGDAVGQMHENRPVCLPPGLQTQGDQSLEQKRGSTDEISDIRLFGGGEEFENNRAHLRRKRLCTTPACKVLAGSGWTSDHGQMSVDWRGGEGVPGSAL